MLDRVPNRCVPKYESMRVMLYLRLDSSDCLLSYNLGSIDMGISDPYV
jgi:hypothetical protein